MYTVILITAKNKAQATKIARALLKEKLIACANIVGGVTSLFWWQGAIDSATETLLIIKTKRRLVKKIIAAVKKLHSYDVPEIIALPIVEGNKDYLRWINASVR